MHRQDPTQAIRQGENSADKKVDFGDGSIYVGDLPGLHEWNRDRLTTLVLGMDVLRTRPKLFLRCQGQRSVLLDREDRECDTM